MAVAVRVIQEFLEVITIIHYRSPDPEEEWEGNIIDLWNTFEGLNGRAIILSEFYAFDLQIFIWAINCHRGVVAVPNLNIVCYVQDDMVDTQITPLSEPLAGVLSATMTVMNSIVKEHCENWDSETNFAENDTTFHFPRRLSDDELPF